MALFEAEGETHKQKEIYLKTSQQAAFQTDIFTTTMFLWNYLYNATDVRGL
jgi:hypothetical protein